MNVAESVRTTITVRREDAEWAQANGRKLSELLGEYISRLRAECKPEEAMKILDREQELLDCRRREVQAHILRAQRLREQEGKLQAAISAMVAGEFGMYTTPPKQVVGAIWARINQEYENANEWSALVRHYPTNEARIERIRKGWAEARALVHLSAAAKGTTGGA